MYFLLKELYKLLHVYKFSYLTHQNMSANHANVMEFILNKLVNQSDMAWHDIYACLAG